MRKYIKFNIKTFNIKEYAWNFNRQYLSFQYTLF